MLMQLILVYREATYMKKFLFLFFLPFFFSCKDNKDVLAVDYQVNVSSQSYDTNYFNWSFGDKKIEDKFDVSSQASLKKSTGEFNSVRYAGRKEDRQLTMPQGLRALFLYAIADWSLLEEDNLHVEKNEGVIRVRYVHHGKAFELNTDATGAFDVLTGSKMAKDFAVEDEHKEYTIREEHLMGGDATLMKNLNWESLTFNPDKYTSSSPYHFEGKLQFEFNNNVLHIYGKLHKKGA